MANTATLTSLTARVRSITDNVGSAFVSDSEIAVWLNVGLSKLHDILVVHFEDYYEYQQVFNTVVGQSDYALPVDFYKLQGVDMFTGGVKYTVPRFMNQERNRRQFSSLPLFCDLAYRVIGNVLRFIPSPTAAVQIMVFYTPSFVPLVLGTDLVDQVLQPGWEEYAVLDAAVQCRVKDELGPNDIAAMQALQQQVAQNIERVVDDRDANEAGHVVDVSGRLRGRGMYGGDSCDEGDW